MQLTLLTGSAAFVAAVWLILAVRSLRASLTGNIVLKPDARPPALPDNPQVLIDILIPAHNEAETIAPLLVNLLSQEHLHNRIRITVIDDHSVDATADAARTVLGTTSPHRILTAADRPPGWVGKTWALHQGANLADAPWIACIDADIELHPQTLAGALHLALSADCDMVSLVPGYDCKTIAQGTIALALGHLLWQMHPFSAVANPQSRNAFAHGVFIFVRRDKYLAIDGHASVRSEIVEDIQLALRLKETQARLQVRAAPDLVNTHMYGNIPALIRGLRKNAYAGMDYQFYKFATAWIFGITFAWLPPLALLYGIAIHHVGLIAFGLLGWIAQTLAVEPLRRHLKLGVLYGWLHPLGILGYLIICTFSVRDYQRGRIVWDDVVITRDTVREKRQSS